MTTYRIMQNHTTIKTTTNRTSAIIMAKHWNKINKAGNYHVIEVRGFRLHIVWKDFR